MWKKYLNDLYLSLFQLKYSLKYLILCDSLGYNADVLCLQEVDKKIFNNTLLFGLDDKGFEGRFCVKSGENGESNCKEGCAIFYRKSKFRWLLLTHFWFENEFISFHTVTGNSVYSFIGLVPSCLQRAFEHSYLIER